MLRITIQGPPVPKARARVVSRQGARHTSFTPSPTAKWEAHARRIALAARARSPGWNIGARAYDVTIRIYRHHRRGDLDNYAKACLDSLNGIVWTDDARVTHLDATMIDGDPAPRVEIDVEVMP